jgi:murein DD-endopeptidase MepM/ murein hydrolase activator NlpD
LDEAARVYHSNGTTTLLAASSLINSSDHVGKVGTTGAASTGNHLHMAFNIDGTTKIKKVNCIDPEWFYPTNFFSY